MNRDWVMHHLGEAQRAIQETMAEIGTTPEYGYGEFWVEMQHIYHYLNTAWNARDATPTQVENATDEDFNGWSQLPADLPMMQVNG